MNEPVAVRLAGLESLVQAGFSGINQRLDRVNGAVGRHDAEIAEMASHGAVVAEQWRETLAHRKRLAEWQATQEAEIKAIGEKLAEASGARRGSLGLVRELVSILALCLLAWQAISAHRSVASPPAPAPASVARP